MHVFANVKLLISGPVLGVSLYKMSSFSLPVSEVFCFSVHESETFVIL